MSQTLTTDNIKHRIAHILMKSPVGLIRKTLAVQIDAEPDAINQIINEMTDYDHLKVDGNRIKITSIGRAHYAETNDSPVKPNEPKIRDPAQMHDEIIEAPANDTKIQPVNGFRTPDGIFHESRSAAEAHLQLGELAPMLERFFEDCNVKKMRRGLVRANIIEWERYRMRQQETRND